MLEETLHFLLCFQKTETHRLRFSLKRTINLTLSVSLSRSHSLYSPSLCCLSGRNTTENEDLLGSISIYTHICTCMYAYMYVYMVSLYVYM